jgi:hypothetical protein
MFTLRRGVGDILGSYHPIQNAAEYSDFDRYLRMVARSNLLERMHITREAIHSQAGRRLMYEEVYLQPNRSVCRYVFLTKNHKFHMTLAILSAGPTVTFSCSKTHDWIGAIMHPFGRRLAKKRVTVRCKLLIDPETVSDNDVKQWFSYLLSGLRRSLKPADKISRSKI